MGEHKERDERKARGIVLKQQFEELGLSHKEVADRAGWSESYVSRAWNEAEPNVAPSPRMLQCQEQVLQERKQELSEKVDGVHGAVTLVDTCNAAGATLSAKTREDMSQRLKSRLHSSKTGKPDVSVLPDNIAGAMFKIEDGCPTTTIYVMVVKKGDTAEELASVAHELLDLSHVYGLKAKNLRQSSGGKPEGKLPKSAY